jgi:hypothetical protein
MKKLFVVLLMLAAMNVNAQWVQMSNGMGNQNVTSMVASGNNIFAGTDSLNLYGNVYISTNNGTNWSKTNFPSQPVWSLAVIGTNILAGTAGGGILYSSNNGNTWNVSSLTGRVICTFTVLGNNIFAGAVEYGVYMSTNNGVNWSIVNFLWHSVYALTSHGNNIFAGNSYVGVFKSNDNGSNWTQTTLDSANVRGFAVIGNNIFAGTRANGIVNRTGVFLTTNDGTSWSQTSLTNKSVYSLASSGNYIFAGTDSSGVYLSNNNGVNWLQRNQGLNTSSTISSFLIANNYIFAGTYGNSVWRRSLSEIIGVQNIGTEVPSAFSLGQNYPNPFNPISNIKYKISKSSDVRITVFDVTGKEVEVLVDEKQLPGEYLVTFDGSMLTSGVYFYKLVAGDFSETKKMLLIK